MTASLVGAIGVEEGLVVRVLRDAGQMAFAEIEKTIIRAMITFALSYHHRLADGRGALQFVVRVKEPIEDPETILIGAWAVLSFSSTAMIFRSVSPTF